jgi:hydrogenase maturation factor
LSTGKLPIDILERILKKYAISLDKRVKLGAEIGEDAAVVDIGDRFLILKTDPITFATDSIGHYAVVVNANDIATMGARPKWMLTTLLLPPGTTDERAAESIFRDISTECKNLGISLIGGHTEITHGIDRPIVCGCMAGEVKKEELVLTRGAMVGDEVLISKGICIEGTSIIAREKYDELMERGYSEDFLKRAKEFLFDPGISVVKDALVSCRAAKVHSMHDPTEGGIIMGLLEMIKASSCGMLIHKDKIPIYKESSLLCSEYGMDPLKTISSGALLLTASRQVIDDILKALRDAKIDATVIGDVIEGKDLILKVGEHYDYINSDQSFKDEISRLFDD